MVSDSLKTWFDKEIPNTPLSEFSLWSKLVLGYDVLFSQVIAFLFWHLGRDNYSKFTKISLFSVLVLIPLMIMLINVLTPQKPNPVEKKAAVDEVVVPHAFD